jgi:hypothetical protein
MRFRNGRVDGDSQMPDLAPEAIPSLTEFCRLHPDGSVWNWLNVVSDVSVAAAFGKLFWPDFVVHDGGIFLREFFSEETYKEWKAQPGMNTFAVERVMNHVHVADLFLNSKLTPPDDSAISYLAAVLGKLWSLRALEDFGPNRVIVDLENDSDGDPVLIVSQGQEDP